MKKAGQKFLQTFLNEMLFLEILWILETFLNKKGRPEYPISLQFEFFEAISEFLSGNY